jgi:hypothetical protein
MAQYRRSVSGMKVENESLWGNKTAYERYGKPEFLHGAPNPEDRHRPQRLGDDNNLQGNYYDNDVRNNWRRGAGESAEGKPNFDKANDEGIPVQAPSEADA